MYIALVLFQTIASFVLMDINGPFFIINHKSSYNLTSVISIITWDRYYPGRVLLGFALNLPIVLVLNILTLKISSWMRERIVIANDFWTHIFSVVLIYLALVLFWSVFLQDDGGFEYYFHPLAVLLGVGFFLSNIISFSIWYFVVKWKNEKKRR